MKAFSVECDVWVKPMFRKARPKKFVSTWLATDSAEMMRLVREYYASKKFVLLSWNELELHNHQRRGLLDEKPARDGGK